MLCVDSKVSLKEKVKLTEYFLETKNVEAFYPAPSSMLSAFSVGKQNALVIDLGHESSTFEAIYEGYRLKKSFETFQNQFSGTYINSFASNYLNSSSKEGFEKYFNKDYSKTLAKSVKNYYETQAIHELKRSFFRVCKEPYNSEDLSEYDDEVFELPDKSKVTVSKERFQASELMFNPKFTLDSSMTEKETRKRNISQEPEVDSIQEVVKKVLFNCNPDIRKELAYNILLVGGNALLPGCPDRLSYELGEILPNMLKARIISHARPIQRQFATWIGGSVLASLGTFQQMWCSKQELQEYGAHNLLLTKCQQ